MITELTPEQEARFPEFVEKWTKIGLCSDPADRPRAEAGVRLAYEIAGLMPPKQIIWCQSPYAMKVADSKIRMVDARVTTAITFNIMNSIRENLGEKIGDGVLLSIGPSYQASVTSSVGAHLALSVEACIGAPTIWDVIHGQHDALNFVLEVFYAEVLNLKAETEVLRGHWEVAQSANWWLPREKTCFICERPTVFLDESRRLHREDGPAIEYPDGWGAFLWHDVQVPEYIITKPDDITVEAIKNEGNVEVRRVMLERYGEERYLHDSNTDMIDHDPRFGTLYITSFLDDEPLVMVKVLNSTREPDGTRKSYFLRVPPFTRTAREAVAWVAGFDDPADYDPLIET